jgi:glycosyltransferase involved in cell wall biosynthesis
MTAAATPLLILAQAAGNMIAEVAEEAGSCAIFGTFHQEPRPVLPPEVTVHAATPLSTTSTVGRLWSWVRYLLEAAVWLVRQPRNARILLFSNPPVLPVLGYLLRKLTGRRYSVVVYDIYPDLLVRIGKLRPDGPITRLWWKANRLAYGAADRVITLGACMGETLAPQIRDLAIVPPWVDTAAVRPVAKRQNPVALECGQGDKLTVMYMGKMGVSHDLETMLAAAARLQRNPGVHFLFVGAGPKWETVRQQAAALSNTTVLPWQRERVPLFHAMADIAVVSLEAEASGMEVPSRTVFHMAAGSAILAVSDAPNDLERLVSQHGCGRTIGLGDVDAFVDAILHWAESPAELRACRMASRRAAEQEYSRSVNVPRMLELLGARR